MICNSKINHGNKGANYISNWKFKVKNLIGGISMFQIITFSPLDNVAKLKTDVSSLH